MDGPASLTRLAAIVQKRFHFAAVIATNKGIANFQRPHLHDNGGSGTSPRFHLRFDHGPARRGSRRCFEFHYFGLQGHHLEQVVDSRTLRCGDGTNNRFAAPVLRRESLVLELFLHPIDICSRKIDLVERDHDLYMRSGLGVIDGFNRLRHDAVVGCDDEHDNVGHIGSPGAHRGEGGVARCVDESNFRSIAIDAIGPDMLRDPASLPRCHTRSCEWRP